MSEQIFKEVYFDQYCKSCEHKDKEEKDEPCGECLAEPMNTYSHKPTKYEKGDK